MRTCERHHEDFKAGVSCIRNPVITRVMRELELMEEWGSGYLRISEACDQGGYSVPEWVELGSVVRTVFRPLPAISDAVVNGADVVENGTINGRNGTINGTTNVTINERQTWFLNRLRACEPVRPKDLADHFGVSLRTARRDVGTLTDLGLVTFEGSKKTGAYRLTRSRP